MHQREPLAVSMREAERLLGVSHRTVATLVADCALGSKKVGRRRIVPMSSIEELLRESSIEDMQKERSPNETKA